MLLQPYRRGGQMGKGSDVPAWMRGERKQHLLANLVRGSPFKCQRCRRGRQHSHVRCYAAEEVLSPMGLAIMRGRGAIMEVDSLGWRATTG